MEGQQLFSRRGNNMERKEPPVVIPKMDLVTSLHSFGSTCLKIRFSNSNSLLKI
jgi:hypothetical protein